MALHCLRPDFDCCQSKSFERPSRFETLAQKLFDQNRGRRMERIDMAYRFGLIFNQLQMTCMRVPQNHIEGIFHVNARFWNSSPDAQSHCRHDTGARQVWFADVTMQCLIGI